MLVASSTKNDRTSTIQNGRLIPALHTHSLHFFTVASIFLDKEIYY